MASTHLVQTPAKKARDRDTGHRNRVTTEEKTQVDLKLEDGAHRRTTRLEKSASEVQDLTRTEESVNQRGANDSVHCAYDAHVPSSGQPRIRMSTWDSTSNPNSASMEATT
jgi:hypothetical protein